MANISENYQVKLLNGLVVKDLSEKQLIDGLQSGKFLPSDFLWTNDGDWIHLKETNFVKKNHHKTNGWMALFVLSFILNIVMLFLLFWQKTRIELLIN